MINYLFSGIDKVNGFTKEQATSLKKDIKDNSIITFIASDFDNTEKTDTNKKLLIDAFNNIGINFKEMDGRKKHRWEEDKKLPIKYLEYLKELKSKYRANYLCNSK